MRGKLSLVYVLAGIFVVVCPLSLATGLESSQTAKYVRMLLTVTVVLAGMASPAGLRIGSATRALLVFAVLWVLSALWSTSPLWGLIHKGNFFLALASGITMGATVRRLEDAAAGIRFLSLVSFVVSTIVVFGYLRAPDVSLSQDRLAIWGINSNDLAQSAAPLSILCAFVALSERRGFWKILSATAFCFALIVMVLSGSRGGVAMGLLGCGLVLKPFGRRPSIVILAVGLVLAVGYVAMELLPSTGPIRIVGEFGKDTRSGIWRYALRQFSASPIIGAGWLTFDGKSWAAVQSAVIQVLAEAGIIGALVFLGTVLFIILRWIKTNSRVRMSQPGRVWSYLCAALIASPLAHGLAESSTVMGTSLNPLILGMGVALMDRLIILARDTRGNPVMLWWYPTILAAPSDVEGTEVRQQDAVAELSR